jgi:hypothetical protein
VVPELFGFVPPDLMCFSIVASRSNLPFYWPGQELRKEQNFGCMAWFSTQYFLDSFLHPVANAFLIASSGVQICVKQASRKSPGKVGDRRDAANSLYPTNSKKRPIFDDPPIRIVRALFHQSPSAALIRLACGWTDGDRKKHRTLLMVEHGVRDVVWKAWMQALKAGEVEQIEAELDKLSRYEEW